MSEILEANDYFILAMVSAVVTLGSILISGYTVGAQLTAVQTIQIGVGQALGVTSLFLAIGFILAGIVRKIVKRKRVSLPPQGSRL